MQQQSQQQLSVRSSLEGLGPASLPVEDRGTSGGGRGSTSNDDGPQPTLGLPVSGRQAGHILRARRSCSNQEVPAEPAEEATGPVRQAASEPLPGATGSPLLGQRQPAAIRLLPRGAGAGKRLLGSGSTEGTAATEDGAGLLLPRMLKKPKVGPAAVHDTAGCPNSPAARPQPSSLELIS